MMSACQDVSAAGCEEALSGFGGTGMAARRIDIHSVEVAQRWLNEIRLAPGSTFNRIHVKLGGKAPVARALLDDLMARHHLKECEEKDSDRPGPRTSGFQLTATGLELLERLMKASREFQNIRGTYALLDATRRAPGATILTLKQDFALSTRDKIQALEPLVEQGYVDRVEVDRKGKRHTLTLKGAEAHARLAWLVANLRPLEEAEDDAPPGARPVGPRLRGVRENPGALQGAIREAVVWQGGVLRVRDEQALLEEAIDVLVNTAVFASGQGRDRAREMIRALASQRGIHLASIQRLYVARARGLVKDVFTVPALNIRGPTYDVARAAFRAAVEHRVGAVIFEIARSETGYTEQRPAEYAIAVTAAAIKESYRGPLFLQGDHYQFSPERYRGEPEAEVRSLENLVRESLDAGFRNIDVDASTQIDRTRPRLADQQRLNAILSARMTSFIRDQGDLGPHVAVGVEVGKIGSDPTSLDDLEAFMATYAAELQRLGQGPGAAKVSLNTILTSAGEQEVLFDHVESFGKVCRERYGMAGVAQHGTGATPDHQLHRFRAAGACELHLASGLQNLLLEHPRFPPALLQRIDEWVAQQHRASGQGGPPPARLRKKAFGPFKRDLWAIEPDARDAIMRDMERKFATIFRELGVIDTLDLAKAVVRMDP